ncbi:MAG: peptidoglycan editing factor PgeF [Wenzhouxiangella sp.]|nr:MAG: peptidoglycan editing factor PgeF [Wenzhouxiangella sp.]
MMLIDPDWPAVAGVGAVQTTRRGGISQRCWTSFNLGLHCGDDPEAVAENRRRLAMHLPAAPRWIRQVHGSHLVGPEQWQPDIEADAAWTDRPGQVLAILTADCLPILLASRHDRLVAAIHAGWRGLAAGIIARAVDALPAEPASLQAWIGPGISADHYEVGAEVRDVMVARHPELAMAFARNAAGRFQADLKAVARWQLRASGVGLVLDSGLCTATDSERFFSYRRDQGRTGRQATLVWIE